MQSTDRIRLYENVNTTNSITSQHRKDGKQRILFLLCKTVKIVRGKFDLPYIDTHNYKLKDFLGMKKNY